MIWLRVSKKKLREHMRRRNTTRTWFWHHIPKILIVRRFLKYPAPKTDEERCREVLAAKCPKCENVDNRFMLEHDKDRSSFGVVETYAGSGQDLRCFCCNHTFKFCTGKLWYEKLNCVPVPLSWVQEELGVDITLYM
jgi:hypothetical protein